MQFTQSTLFAQFFQGIAVILTLIDGLALIFLIGFSAVVIFYHVMCDGDKWTYHLTQITKVLGLLSISCTLAVLLSWIYYVAFTVQTYTQSFCTFFHTCNP